MNYDAIKKITDKHKRWFALGFEYYFSKRADLNQSGVAVIAGIQVSSISYLRNGNEAKFPGQKNQTKIAAVFNKEIVDLINKGREIEEGSDSIPDAINEKPGIEGGKDPDQSQKKANDTPALPFPHYLEVMKLPIKYRAMAIKRVAAEAHGFKNWLESTGDRMLHGDAPSPLEERYLNGEITEEDIYKEYKNFFEALEKRTLEEFKKRGLL